MKDYIYQMFEKTGNLSVPEIAARILVSAVIGLVIFISYWLTHKGTIYSKKFNVTLLTLTVLTTTVMTVIGNNIALSLGMVGALSIVRFRTAIKDSRDTAYIFWTIIVGICCGVGDYTVACAGSICVFVILTILGAVKNDNRILLIIRASRTAESKIESMIFSYFNRKANQRVKNTTEESVEFIYELSKKDLASAQKQEKSITDLLYETNAVEYVNIVTQNDEISS